MIELKQNQNNHLKRNVRIFIDWESKINNVSKFEGKIIIKPLSFDYNSKTSLKV